MSKTTGHSKAAAKPSRAVTTTAKPIPIADFDDTIAHNRALPTLDVDSIPRPPAGYRATDPHVRNRRLRKLASELRAEAVLALDEAAGRDTQADLGKYAPDSAQAAPLRQRLADAGRLRTAARTLFNYACEIDQIALSDALRFLEAEHKQFAHAVEHEPGLAENYSALTTLFESRAGAIAEGIARASKGEPEPDEAPEADDETADEPTDE